MINNDEDEYITFREAIKTPGIYNSEPAMGWIMAVGQYLDLVNGDPSGPAIGREPTPGQFNGIFCFYLGPSEHDVGVGIVHFCNTAPAAGIQDIKWRKMEHLELRLCLKS